jgi:predicted component of type VI protein secretion system
VGGGVLVPRAGREEANATADRWKASEAKYRDKIRAANQQAWVTYHREQARVVLETARSLADEHLARADRLAEEVEADG